MGLLSWMFGWAPADRNAAPVFLAGKGEFGFEVVGESQYQDALSDICGGHCEAGHQHECKALLLPEPSNPYDPNAVKVIIDGQTVAYLSRELARKYLNELAKIGRAGEVTVCKALINGGWDRGEGDRGHFGVELDVSWPLRVDDPEANNRPHADPHLASSSQDSGASAIPAIRDDIKTKIFQSVVAHLESLNFTLGLPLTTSANFTPIQGQRWLRISHIPAGTQAFTTPNPDEHRGLFQVDVFTPVTSSPRLMPASEIARKIADHFAEGTRLTTYGVETTMTRAPEIGPNLSEPGWEMLPISIYYFTDSDPGERRP